MRNTFDFDFKNGEFKMKNGTAVVLKGSDALRLWIEKCLRTQLDRYAMYNSYGANIEDLTFSSLLLRKSQPDGCPPFLAVNGKTYSLDFIESELKREIETALLRHDDIQSMSNFAVSAIGSDLSVSFTLTTAYGEEDLSYDIE
jgi:hypothetical protein